MIFIVLCLGAIAIAGIYYHDYRYKKNLLAEIFANRFFRISLNYNQWLNIKKYAMGLRTNELKTFIETKIDRSNEGEIGCKMCRVNPSEHLLSPGVINICDRCLSMYLGVGGVTRVEENEPVYNKEAFAEKVKTVINHPNFTEGAWENWKSKQRYTHWINADNERFSFVKKQTTIAWSGNMQRALGLLLLGTYAKEIFNQIDLLINFLDVWDEGIPKIPEILEETPEAPEENEEPVDKLIKTLQVNKGNGTSATVFKYLLAIPGLLLRENGNNPYFEYAPGEYITNILYGHDHKESIQYNLRAIVRQINKYLKAFDLPEINIDDLVEELIILVGRNSDNEIYDTHLQRIRDIIIKNGQHEKIRKWLKSLGFEMDRWWYYSSTGGPDLQFIGAGKGYIEKEKLEDDLQEISSRGKKYAELDKVEERRFYMLKDLTELLMDIATTKTETPETSETAEEKRGKCCVCGDTEKLMFEYDDNYYCGPHLKKKYNVCLNEFIDKILDRKFQDILEKYLILKEWKKVNDGGYMAKDSKMLRQICYKPVCRFNNSDIKKDISTIIDIDYPDLKNSSVAGHMTVMADLAKINEQNVKTLEEKEIKQAINKIVDKAGFEGYGGFRNKLKIEQYLLSRGWKRKIILYNGSGDSYVLSGVEKKDVNIHHICEIRVTGNAARIEQIQDELATIARIEETDLFTITKEISSLFG